MGGKKPGGRLPLLRGEEAENSTEGSINAGFPGGEGRVFQGDLVLERFCDLILRSCDLILMFRDFVLRVGVFCLSFFFSLSNSRAWSQFRVRVFFLCPFTLHYHTCISFINKENAPTLPHRQSDGGALSGDVLSFQMPPAV